MQIAMTFMAVIAGMAFSLAIALLAEELIFAHVVRRFFISADHGQDRSSSDRPRSNDRR